jgi:hypothetical protein
VELKRRQNLTIQIIKQNGKIAASLKCFIFTHMQTHKTLTHTHTHTLKRVLSSYSLEFSSTISHQLYWSNKMRKQNLLLAGKYIDYYFFIVVKTKDRIDQPSLQIVL